SNKAIFHMGFIHSRWFESIPTETNNYITIAQGTKTYTTNSLQYINQMRTASVYTPNLKEKFNKKFQYGTTMSVAKTCVQIAVAEGVASELTGFLTEFILKYRQNTGLNIEVIHSVQLNNENQEPFSAATATTASAGMGQCPRKISMSWTCPEHCPGHVPSKCPVQISHYIPL